MSRLKNRRTLVIAGMVVLAAVLAVVLVSVFGGNDSGTATTATEATATTVTDPAVVDLQRVMTRLGYYNGPIDGVYGAATTAAVREMQKALGVNADGVYGPATAAALKGKATNVTIDIQTELTKYGYYTGPIDGHYGPATKAAVEKLQTDLGVTADGLVGAETVAAFDKAVADGTLKPATTTPAATTATTTPATTKATSTTATTTETTETTASTTTTK